LITAGQTSGSEFKATVGLLSTRDDTRSDILIASQGYDISIIAENTNHEPSTFLVVTLSHHSSRFVVPSVHGFSHFPGNSAHFVRTPGFPNSSPASLSAAHYHSNEFDGSGVGFASNHFQSIYFSHSIAFSLAKNLLPAGNDSSNAGSTLSSFVVSGIVAALLVVGALIVILVVRRRRHLSTIPAEESTIDDQVTATFSEVTEDELECVNPLMSEGSSFGSDAFQGSEIDEGISIP
jgi:hypothetical protein